MKPKLNYKIPLTALLTFSAARKYIDFYHYLDHYSFGPYYVDDAVLPTDYRLLYVDIIDADSYVNIVDEELSEQVKKKRPALKDYINAWASGGWFYPKDATYIMWATYEMKTIDNDGIIKYVAGEGGFKELLEKTLSRGLDYCMEARQAEELLNHYKYLINNCVLIDDSQCPDYYVIESMEVVNVTALEKNEPDIYKIIKKNKGIASTGSHTIIVTIYSEVDANGNHQDTKRMLLIELLNEYMVQVTNKTG